MCIGWLGEILMYIQMTNNGKLSFTLYYNKDIKDTRLNS